MNNKTIPQFNKKLLFMGLFLTICFCSLQVQAQTKKTYNLSSLLQENKLMSEKSTLKKDDGKAGAISVEGVVWIKDEEFSSGTIEVDLRGKDIFQKSFLGIAFHGYDTVAYDVVYFRPFNFRSADSVRKIHAVQYMSLPDQDWYILREQFPGKYENAVTPAPKADEWFHAKIVLKGNDISVFVNYSEQPSLKVQKLNGRKKGLVGLWAVGSEGDFANLSIQRD